MEETKQPSVGFSGSDQPLPDNATVVLKVYLQKDLIKAYMIDVKSVRTMPLDVFRSKFGIPTRFGEQFSFAVNSLFQRKIPHADESKFKLSDALLNFAAVVNNSSRAERGQEKAFKLMLFTEAYEIAPTFKTRKEYSDCLMKLVELQFYIESLKEKQFFKAAF
jgi:hypothetical protein